MYEAPSSLVASSILPISPSVASTLNPSSSSVMAPARGVRIAPEGAVVHHAHHLQTQGSRSPTAGHEKTALSEQRNRLVVARAYHRARGQLTVPASGRGWTPGAIKRRFPR